jgi:AraC family transcriptional regulator
LIESKDGSPSRASPPSNVQLDRVIDYIDAHLDEPLTIDRLSGEAGASNSHLRAWFKVATGMTIHRYVLRRRLERARSLLQQDELSLTEIAFASGFAHQSHMSRWMRQEFGATPHALRRRFGQRGSPDPRREL